MHILISKWNRLDSFVAIISVIALQATEVTFLRSLRAIRPLRIAARSGEIKIVLSTLMSSFVPAMHSILFVVVLLLILSIVGVQLFSGKMSFCSNGQTFVLPRIKYGYDKDRCVENLVYANVTIQMNMVLNGHQQLHHHFHQHVCQINSNIYRLI